MSKLKKVLSELFSMRVALLLLALLTAACILGSIIPQGEVAASYTTAYPALGNLILILKLDDVFHCWWFILLTSVLCLNLLGCNLLRFPRIMRGLLDTYTPQGAHSKIMTHSQWLITDKPSELFRAMGFHRVQDSKFDGYSCLYAVRNRIGIWGAWLTHLGMLIIIIGFALGQIFTQKYEVYGVPGQTKAVEGSNLEVTIDDFQVVLRDDDTVEQYLAQLTVRNTSTGESISGSASVNHPLTAFGYEMYQNATGYAADILVLKNVPDGATLTEEELREQAVQSEVLCVGEFTQIADNSELLIALRSVYPDLMIDSSGMPANASDQLVNPGYLYILYYQEQLLGMNVLKSGELITVEPYTIAFVNPRMYTLIEIKYDPFSWLTLIGAILMIAALLLSFYVRTEELWAFYKPEAGGWCVGGYSRKGGLLYREKLASAAEKLGGIQKF